MASIRGETRRNRLLRGLTEDELDRLTAGLEPVTCGTKEVLQRPAEPLRHVYFPVTAVMSMMQSASGDGSVEVATVGNEGVIGLPVFLGAATGPGTTLVQIPGAALRMEAAAFRAAVAGATGLRDILGRYTLALLTQIAQSSACNRLHRIEQRCARWILMTHDRVASDEFSLTHEFLAQMLGVRRASVSEAAAELAHDGLVRYSRGKIEVIDRQGLEAQSCECYRIIVDEYDRLLP